jgi:hypothetical protein
MVASAKCFGVLTGRGAFSLSGLAKNWFLPTTETEKKRAKLGFLTMPTVFEKLVDRFDGSKLPTNDMLANIAHREFGVPASWMQRAVSLFVTSARDVGVLDSGGVLRYAATLHSLRSGDPTGPPISDVEVRPSIDKKIGQANGEPDHEQTLEELFQRLERRLAGSDLSEPASAGNSWSFQLGDGFVRVQTSHDLSMALWHKLKQYVDVLRPPGTAAIDTGETERNDS